jgi:hypothetical protein
MCFHALTPRWLIIAATVSPLGTSCF